MTDITMKHTNINAGTDSLRASDDAAKAVQQTPNRVALDDIKAKIEHVDYVHPHRHPHITLAIITMKNGFVVIGHSAPADPKNYNENLGGQLAYDDAVRQIWPLEAYLLREKMTTEV